MMKGGKGVKTSARKRKTSAEDEGVHLFNDCSRHEFKRIRTNDGRVAVSIVRALESPPPSCLSKSVASRKPVPMKCDEVPSGNFVGFPAKKHKTTTKEYAIASPARVASSKHSKSKKKGINKGGYDTFPVHALDADITYANRSVENSGRSTPSESRNNKLSRSLRHFGAMVCKKVEEKGKTNCNEVADELVKHFLDKHRKDDPSEKFDEKNIRRRVYDALNVLMAMEIVLKEKKEIKWNGLPTRKNEDSELLKKELELCRQALQRKREELRELLAQQVSFWNLVKRNQRRCKAGAASATSARRGKSPTPNPRGRNQHRHRHQRNQYHHSSTTPLPRKQRHRHYPHANVFHDASGPGVPPDPGDDVGGPDASRNEEKIPLPFIVVNAKSSAFIQCHMSCDLKDVMVEFNIPFEINDDITVLKRLGLQKASLSVLQEMFPEDVLTYCQDHGLLDSILVVSDSNLDPSDVRSKDHHQAPL